MICATCGDQVEWQGPLSNLTHTLCLGCGAINNQIPEDELPEDEPTPEDIQAFLKIRSNLRFKPLLEALKPITLEIRQAPQIAGVETQAISNRRLQGRE
jgi:hypothetical protein